MTQSNFNLAQAKIFIQSEIDSGRRYAKIDEIF
jgi:hypothetical protein